MHVDALESAGEVFSFIVLPAASPKRKASDTAKC